MNSERLSNDIRSKASDTVFTGRCWGIELEKMLELCRNRNLGDSVRTVNRVSSGVVTFDSRIFGRDVNLLEMRIAIFNDFHCGIVVRFRRLRNPARWRSGLRCPTCGRQGTACPSW